MMLPSPEQIRQEKTWREMGLKDGEFAKIGEILGRDPNYTELGMYAVLWSEHCAYKHSRPLFRYFPTEGPQILQGPGENAGIIDLGDGDAVVMKVESHNHPSAVEPYQGAATGVGGILRDIFTMGARPIASLNSLRFGPLTDARTRFLFEGVVSGIAGYGNCVGVPTVGGEVVFDPAYKDNPLVNAMAVGLVRHDGIAKAVASGVGNPVMVVGSRTGRDGIHGATFASEELSEKSESKRPSVQVGDPFTEKLLIEACMEAIASGDVVAIQDMGAAGLTSSSAEMASRGGVGIEMDILKVPRREEGMSAYEIMLSESQERMLVIPKKGREDDLGAIFKKWGLQAVVVGQVTADGMLRILEGDEVVAEVPAESLSDAPVYSPEKRRPEYLDQAWSWEQDQLPLPTDYNQALMEMMASHNIASKEWVFGQYDQHVQVNTAVSSGSDAAVLRIKGKKKAIALTIDCNGRLVYLDPREGSKAAVAEAARNLVCSGAKPLAITDGLNFASPERPEIYWQFYESVMGISEACRALDTPVTGGNVSFYNETGGSPIYPTPMIGMVGLIEDLSHIRTQGWAQEGDLILLLGEHDGSLGGSEYLAVRGLVTGRPPQVDLQLEARVQRACLDGIRQGLVRSAHDLSQGGLAVALAEACISGGKGAQVRLDDQGLRPDVLLFNEAHSRILVSLAEEDLLAFQHLAQEVGAPVALIGRVGGEGLEIQVASGPSLSLSVKEMERAWRESIPTAMA